MVFIGLYFVQAQKPWSMVIYIYIIIKEVLIGNNSESRILRSECNNGLVQGLSA